MDIFFIGRLNDPIILAGLGVGITINNFYSSFLYPLSQALLTISSQAYGKGELHLCGVYLNKSRAIMIVFFIPVVFLLFFSNKILISIG